MACPNKCKHERHLDYLDAFSASITEDEYVRYIIKYLLDPNLSPDDGDDLDLFQSLVFDSKWGRLHIFVYEDLFNEYHIRPVRTATIFCRHLEYLGKISGLFLLDAFSYIFKKNDPEVVKFLLRFMPLKVKLLFIMEAENHPLILRAVPKLKLYNLFS
jgi:hypothetical protein